MTIGHDEKMNMRGGNWASVHLPIMTTWRSEDHSDGDKGLHTINVVSVLYNTKKSHSVSFNSQLLNSDAI